MPPESEKFEQLKRKAQKVERDILKKNIYRDATFEELAGLDRDIFEISRETHRKFDDIVNQAGIKNPSQMLDESMRHWDERLNASDLPSEEQLIQRLEKDFQVKVKRAPEVYVPTDELVYSGEGGSEQKEEGEDANRVGMAIETLLHLKIGERELKLDDLEILVGKVPEHTWRTRPYWVIAIKDFKIAVLVNNQLGNRTFVLHYKNKADLEKLASLTKEELKDMENKNSLIHHFIYKDPGQFKGELAVVVLKVAERIEMTKPYATYEEAKQAAQKLGIKTGPEYIKHYKEDPRLPSTPNRKYGEEFIGWPDFLRNEQIETREGPYAKYDEAKRAAQKLGIKMRREYLKRYKEDPRLPRSPDEKYGKDFISWPDFLRNEQVETREESYATYDEAKRAAQKLGIKTAPEYRKRYKEDPRLPSAPDQKYGKDFISWPDFLRNEEREEREELYATYGEAKDAVQKLGIKTQAEYNKFHKQDPRLPSVPHKKYGKDFISWPDFLRNEQIEKKEIRKETYPSYEEAKRAVQDLGIKTHPEYRKHYKEDLRLPSNPDKKYGKDFISWPDFLTNEEKEQPYATYEEAKRAVQDLGIKTHPEYRKHYKEDPRLPSAPDIKYGADFTSWADFLGKEKREELYATYDEAKQAAQNLGIKTEPEYKKYYKRDPRLPSNPNAKYGKNFISWPDFLGKK